MGWGETHMNTCAQEYHIRRQEIITVVEFFPTFFFYFKCIYLDMVVIVCVSIHAQDRDVEISEQLVGTNSLSFSMWV